ncbi:MAG: hypothetical protein QNJ68_19595 [Microcoleaceae cyanobacterium MO_207.B10]|nr:hypothetical protein [Microcoleaceae cyanobacterium MO_207.B10]
MNQIPQNCQKLYFNGHLIRFIQTTETLMLIAVDLLAALELHPVACEKIPENAKGLNYIDEDANGQLFL